MCYGIFIRRLLVLSSALLLLALLPGAARAQMPPEVARALESEADYVAFMQKFRNTFTFSTGHNAYTCRQYLDLRRRLPEASVAWMGVRYWGRSQNEYLPCDLVDFLHRVAPAPQRATGLDNLGQELFERMGQPGDESDCGRRAVYAGYGRVAGYFCGIPAGLEQL
jgi:hypothetical protein